MGITGSRMKKVAPVPVREESSGGDRNAHLLGRLNTSVVHIRDCVDCNSEGQDSAFSAEDDTLAEVDRILAECENTDETHSRTFHELPTLRSKPSELCYAKQHASDHSRDSIHAELQLSVAVKNYEQISPPKNLLYNMNTESTATALIHGISAVSSLALPVTYDASEEDLMNTIESEFG